MNSMFSELKDNSVYNKKCFMLNYYKSMLGREKRNLDFIFKTQNKQNVSEYAIFKICTIF